MKHVTHAPSVGIVKQPQTGGMQMKNLVLGFLVLVFATTLSFGDSSTSDSDRRDKALKEIQSCFRRNEVSSRECKKMNSAVETLEAVYNEGDKSVLPTLLKFRYLTRFYGDALLGDRDGFLSAVSRLPERDQKEVAFGLAGQMWGLGKDRFEAIQTSVGDVPQTSPLYELARRMLKTLQTNNASFLVDYFPPNTFTNRAADFEIHWYSGDLYALGEKPLWGRQTDEGVYRITVLPAFSGPRTATLKLLPDGSGEAIVKVLGRDGQIETEKKQSVPRENVDQLTKQLGEIGFWNLPTEEPRPGLDGADVILEGATVGRYRVVVRWCQGKTQFGGVAQSLFKLAGYKLDGC